MSAAQPGELREALAEALEKAIRNRRGPMTTQSYADALLPLVTTYAERLARERAAEELRAAAASWSQFRLPSDQLHGLADALAADAQPVQP